QVGAVVKHFGLDARGQRLLQLVEFACQLLGDAVAVFADPHEAEAEEDFALAVGGGEAAAERVPNGDFGDVRDVNGDSFIGGDLDIAQMLGASRAGDAVHQQHVAFAVDVAAADVE